MYYTVKGRTCYDNSHIINTRKWEKRKKNQEVYEEKKKLIKIEKRI